MKYGATNRSGYREIYVTPEIAEQLARGRRLDRTKRLQLVDVGRDAIRDEWRPWRSIDPRKRES